MAGLYGSFLNEENENYSLYYSKHEQRIAALNIIAEITKKTLTEKYPALDSHISISYVNSMLAVTRYFNDVVRIKAMHKIEIVHKSKMFAFQAKWLATNPVLLCTADRIAYETLTSDEQKICMNTNLIFIGNIANYFFRDHSLGISKDKAEKAMKDIRYLLKTNLYEEHCVSAMLSTLTLNEVL